MVPYAGRPLAPADDCARTMDHQSADITVPALRDAAEALLTTARSLLRNEPQPGRELPPRFELSRIGHRCDNCASSNRTDARDRRQAATNFIRAMPSHQLILNNLNPNGDLAQLRCEDTKHLTRQFR